MKPISNNTDKKIFIKVRRDSVASLDSFANLPHDIGLKYMGGNLTLNRLTAPGMSLLLVVGTANFATASAPIIGMASAQSGVKLDNAKVSGNATLFDGSTIEADGYSRIHLNNGTRMDLAAGSKAQVFNNRASLQSGMSEIQSGSGFEIDAQTLKIRPSAANSIARVKVGTDQRVMVTALNSPVNVMNKDGMLVARVVPGMPLSFLPQAAGGMSFDSTGCVVNKSGSAILVDSTGNQTFQLTGANLTKAIGNKVHVVGSSDSSMSPAGGASQVVKVTSATVTSKGGCASDAAKIGATTTAAGLAAAATAGAGAVAAGAGAAAGAAAGIGVGTTALVVGGVAAATAASLGGAAAAGAFDSTSP